MIEKPASLFPGLDIDEQPTTRTTGILPSQKIAELIAARQIHSPTPIVESEQVQPASLDLRLGPRCYRVRASFLPGRSSLVSSKLAELVMHEFDLSEPCLLERGCVYIVPLLEELALPQGIRARANPKSTTGRLDIFTRLITDGGEEFERVEAGYRGRLYVEIVPRTFSVLVKQGIRLNQLRFIRGDPPSFDKTLGDLHRTETLVYSDAQAAAARIENGLWIAVDLEGPDDKSIVAYRARKHAPVIDLSKTEYYDPAEFWEPIVRPRQGTVILHPDDFYILISKERIRVPPRFAAEMVPIDPSVGEYRVHYAGFFDPGFGYGNNDIKGTPAVLEVRSHEVPFLLEHGQLVGRLQYEHLLDAPHKVYGKGIGSAYQGQGLALSKQFKHT